MHVALLTSANGWRGSGSSYAKLARGLADRGHVAHLVTVGAPAHVEARGDGAPGHRDPGRNTGPREVWGLLRVLRRIGPTRWWWTRPATCASPPTPPCSIRARIVYRYNLNYRRARGDLMDRAYLKPGGRPACTSRATSRRTPWPRRPGWKTSAPSASPTATTWTATLPGPTRAAPSAERYAIRTDARVVLTTAKLTRNKGHEVAIAALGRLHAGGTPLVYLVCGDGGREAELRGLARSARLPAVFTGLLEPGDVVAARSPPPTWWCTLRSTRSSPTRSARRWRAAGAVVAADAGGTAELLGRERGRRRAGAARRSATRSPPRCGSCSPIRRRRDRLGEAARRRIETEFPLRRMIDGYEAALLAVIE